MATDPLASTVVPPPGAASLRPPINGCVLVVDDSEDLRKLVKLQLRQLGVGAQVAENGQRAVEAALAGNFDAVLMDMEMPVLKGHEAIRVLRDRGYAAPIIAMTAHYMNREVELARAAGCDAVLTKPASIDSLWTVLHEWLRE